MIPPVPEKRNKETLVLAQALQCCAESLGTPPRVLCDAAWELQRCMVPLMHLNRAEIVEASLLRPISKGPRMSPTMEEETVFLGTESPYQKSQETATLPCKHQEETPKPKDTVKWSDAPCPPAPYAMAPKTRGDQSQTSRRTHHRSRSRHPASPVQWMTLMTGSLPTWQRGMSYQAGG